MRGPEGPSRCLAEFDGYHFRVFARCAFKRPLVVTGLIGWFNARKKHWQSALRASPLTNWRVSRIKIMGLRHGGTLWATRRVNVVRVTKNAKLQTICCSANLHSGYAVSLGVTQLALQRHEVPETHKNYRHAYGAYRQHDDHAWSAFTGSGFFCGFNDAALGCLLWHQALLDFSVDKSST